MNKKTKLNELDIVKLKELIEIRDKSPMDGRLPRTSVLQDKINETLGLDLDTYSGNGLRTMDLERKTLLKLCLRVLELKEKK